MLWRNLQKNRNGNCLHPANIAAWYLAKLPLVAEAQKLVHSSLKVSHTSLAGRRSVENIQSFSAAAILDSDRSNWSFSRALPRPSNRQNYNYNSLHIILYEFEHTNRYCQKVAYLHSCTTTSTSPGRPSQRLIDKKHGRY